MMNKTLKLGLPKGSLQEATLGMLKKAGYNVNIGSRSYIPTINDPELEGLLIRAQEMSRYVEEGILDAGITGRDWIMENGSDVVEVADLAYAKVGMKPVKWVIAVPNDSKIKSVKGLEGKRIATEAVNLTKQYLKKNKVKAEVQFSWGATEVKAPRLVDAIAELTETGSSLRANNLRIVDVITESTTKLIANKAAWKNPWKRKKLENFSLLLLGAITAENKVGLKMNVSKNALSTILKELPALRNPTISQLSKDGWHAIETIIDESVVREIIPELKKHGAEGIIEYPLNKVIY
ncbi:MAG: ATP phosphoribosyltransferase [Candidatus Ancaeobacter aquaticus]|nr:ATP phosphoribosyltransferase [Candidatus Ancaeobacter aquaticus]